MTNIPARRLLVPAITVLLNFHFAACTNTSPTSSLGRLEDIGRDGIAGEVDANLIRYDGTTFRMPTGEKVQILDLLVIRTNGRIVRESASNSQDQGQGKLIGYVAADGSTTWCSDGTCTATVLMPSSPSGNPTLLITDEIQTASLQNSAENYSEGEPKANDVDLTRHLTPRGINQYGTSTCWYNSSTTIIEWYIRKLIDPKAQLSRPFVLLKLPYKNRDTDALKNISGMRLWLDDALLPTQPLYNQRLSYSATKSQARSMAARVADQAKVIPDLDIETLFRYSRNSGQASRQNVASICEWMRTRQSPVHVFVMYGSIWHAVVGIACKAGDSQIMIVDTVGCPSSGRGCSKWFSASKLQSMLYGAAGTFSPNSNRSAPGNLPDTEADEPVRIPDPQ